MNINFTIPVAYTDCNRNCAFQPNQGTRHYTDVCRIYDDPFTSSKFTESSNKAALIVQKRTTKSAAKHDAKITEQVIQSRRGRKTSMRSLLNNKFYY